MKSRSWAWITTGIAGSGLATLSTYLIVRPRLHHWGSTDDEMHRCMPGDELITTPNLAFTMAITIDAPPEHVWPWLAQLGQGRGGWYSYDWLENLMGLDIHTADHILPQFQNLEAGDVIPTGAVDIPVLAVEPPRSLLLGGAEFATIAFELLPLNGSRTRLLFRNRARLALTPSGIFWLLLLDPGIFIMSRKMLLEIKKRAEKIDDVDHVASYAQT